MTGFVLEMISIYTEIILLPKCDFDEFVIHLFNPDVAKIKAAQFPLCMAHYVVLLLVSHIISFFLIVY